MPKYLVTVREAIYRYVKVEVEADNDLDAGDIAEEQADFSDVTTYADDNVIEVIDTKVMP